MAEACSACCLLGPPTRKPSVLKRGCIGKEERRKRITPRALPASGASQTAGWGSAPVTSVSPAEPLNKMKRSEPGASASSQSRHFASHRPSCCCSLHAAAPIHTHSTSLTARLLLLATNQSFSFPHGVSPTQTMMA